MARRRPEITHRDLCRAAASWLMHEHRCWAAVHEVAIEGGQADALGISLPEPEAHRDLLFRRQLAVWEEYRQQMEADRAPAGAFLWPRPEREPANTAPARIVVIECKRTRADLLADLRAAKLRGYEQTATHAFLLAHPEAVGGIDDGDKDRICGDLSDRGLPASWGVLVVHGGTRGGLPMLWKIRGAKKLRDADQDEVRMWGTMMLRSMCYRVVRRGPMQDEASDRHADAAGSRRG